MAYVVQRLTLNRLQLAREELIRALPFGSQWNYLRLAALVQVSSAATFTMEVGKPLFAFGVCNGTSTPILMGDTTLDAIGAGPGATWAGGTAVWQTSGSGYNIVNNVSGTTAFQKIGSTSTTATGAGGNTYLGGLTQAGSTIAVRTPLWLDIIKSTPVSFYPNPYSFTFYTPGSTAASVDVDPGTFFDRLQTQTLTNMTALTAASLTVAGSMSHNSVFFTWPRFSPTIDICELAVVRFA